MDNLTQAYSHVLPDIKASGIEKTANMFW